MHDDTFFLTCNKVYRLQESYKAKELSREYCQDWYLNSKQEFIFLSIKISNYWIVTHIPRIVH